MSCVLVQLRLCLLKSETQRGPECVHIHETLISVDPEIPTELDFLSFLHDCFMFALKHETVSFLENLGGSVATVGCAMPDCLSKLIR